MMTDYAIPVARADQWREVERCMEMAGIVGYQRALICRIFEEENCTAALDWIDWIETVEGLEAGDGATD